MGNQEVKLIDLKNFVAQFQAQKTWGLAVDQNIISFNSSLLAESLQDRFLDIKQAIVSRAWPDQITVQIKERTPAAVFCLLPPPAPAGLPAADRAGNQSAGNNLWQNEQTQNCLFIDSGGLLFRPAPLILGGKMANIFEVGGGQALLGQQALASEILRFINQAKDGLGSLNLVAYKFLLDKKNHELQAWIDGQWLVFFSLDQDVAGQLLVLQKSLEEKIKEQVNFLEYIDLRIPGKAFYKLRSE